MDPFTHTITGLMVSNAIVTPKETLIPALGAIICSNLPDLDFFTKMLPENTIFMKLHHGISHSIFTGIALVAIVSTTLFYITGFPSFPILFLVCLLSLFSHLLLDALIHNTGIQLFAPFSNKYISLPILLGLNPLSTSAKCYKKSLFVCLNCQFHTSIKSPTVIILTSGFILSIIFFPLNRLLSIITLLVCMCFHLYLIIQRKIAINLFRSKLEMDTVDRFGVFSATFSPRIWQGVASHHDKSFTIMKLDSKEKKILTEKKYSPSVEDPCIKKSREFKPVKDFIRKSIFPHVFSYTSNDEIIVKWKDLGYDFSDSIDLYTLVLRFNKSQELIHHEFRERW